MNNKKKGKFISLIIPTLNAEHFIELLIDRIRRQTLPPNEIIVVDSESTDNTVSKCSGIEGVQVVSILRREFDHGGTRDMALRVSRGDYVLFMTQDALPQDEYYIENLLKAFDDSEVVVAYGRQIARPDAVRMEKLVREYNYPSVSHVRSKQDIPQYGIKTFFCSDVCSAYRRDIYEEIGGFEHLLKTNEDMFYAAKAIQQGYKVAYMANAKVIHSHNFSLREQYQRNYILGIEMEKHRDLLENVSQDSEGKKMVKYVSKELLKRGYVISFIHFGFDCCARFLGNRAGRKKGNSLLDKQV